MQSASDSDVGGRSRQPALGIDGFRYGDLYRSDRLEALLHAFEGALHDADADLHEAWPP